MAGKLIIFSAPSGSGKSTIINYLLKQNLNLAFSISATSRAPRGNEQNGVEYFFLTPEEFRQRIDNNEFLEYEEVYKDRYYGTLKAQVEKQLAEGQNVILDVDVVGGCNIKKYYGDRALSVFIQPPSIEELRRRLTGRGTDTPEVIESRIAKAEYELSFAPKFDQIVVNDNLNKAQAEVLHIIKSFLNKKVKNYPPRLIKTMTILCAITGALSLAVSILSFYSFLSIGEKRIFFLIAAIVLLLIALRQAVIFPKWLRMLKAVKKSK